MLVILDPGFGVLDPLWAGPALPVPLEDFARRLAGHQAILFLPGLGIDSLVEHFALS